MLIKLALTGLLVALLPLAIVWVSSDPNKYRKLVWTAAIVIFEVIMFGAFTRLTDSGLGCPDWPGCYNEANPFLAHDAIRAAESLMPTGPVTVMKAWIEMIHRYLAMAIGVLLTAIMALSWRNWLRSGRSARRFAPGLPTYLFFHVCLVGAFGAFTVTMKLQPVIVTTHLLLAMSMLALTVWLGSRVSAADHAGTASAPVRGLRLPATLALVLLFVQIALGGWTSTNYAALACHDFPLCGGKLVPEMDFGHGFHLWRELGKTATGHYLPFSALTAIHWVHRNFAFVVAACIVWAALAARRAPGDGLRKPANWLLGLVALQIGTGIATVYLSWPLAIAVLHNGGAALLVFWLTMLNYRVHASSVATRP
jgi:cytochrome c oxidase assembly protein subunit 15